MTILTSVIKHIYCCYRRIPYFCSHTGGPGLIPDNASPCGICGRQNDTGTLLFPSTSFRHCHLHPTSASYSYFIPPTSKTHIFTFTFTLTKTASLNNLSPLPSFSFYSIKLQKDYLILSLKWIRVGKSATLQCACV